MTLLDHPADHRACLPATRFLSVLQTEITNTLAVGQTH